MLKTSTTVLWMGAAWGLVLFGTPLAAADPCEANETGKCSAADAQSGDRFGEAVAIDGNVAVMGAPYADDYGPQSGSAYIFHFDGADWIQQPKLVIAGADDGDHSGGHHDVPVAHAQKLHSTFNTCSRSFSSPVLSCTTQVGISPSDALLPIVLVSRVSS